MNGDSNNWFESGSYDGIVIKNNVFVHDESWPTHPEKPTESEMFPNCDNVNFEPVKEKMSIPL